MHCHCGTKNRAPRAPEVRPGARVPGVVSLKRAGMYRDIYIDAFSIYSLREIIICVCL